QEGLIESKIDWPVVEVPFDKTVRDDDHAQNALRTWIDERVRVHRRPSEHGQSRILELNPAKFTLHDWLAVFGLVSTIFALGGGLGAKMAELFQKIAERLGHRLA